MDKLCGEELKYFMNEMGAKQSAQRYAISPYEQRVYAPTQVIFSKPLGITYNSIGLTTPISNYGMPQGIYSYKQTVAEIKNENIAFVTVDQGNLKREFLHHEINMLKEGGIYSKEKAVNYT